MSTRLRAALGIWHARNTHTTGDRAYVAYAVLMVALVTIVPLVRAVWLSATSAAGIALFMSPVAPGVTALVVAALWTSALLLGRGRGPALLPPFLIHALAGSDLPRFETFRGPLLRAGLLGSALTTIAAALVGGSLVSYGLTDPLSAVLFVAAGALVGIITTVAWLAGQSFPRAALLIALSLLALGALSALVPPLHALVPWGWVGLAYPGSGSPHIVALLAALTIALVTMVPALLDRLRVAELLAQAVRWQCATTHAAGMDFGAAVTVYQGRPQLGRHVRAIRSTGWLPLTFLLRNAIGATRTPGRLIVGLVLLASAGVLIALAFAPAAPGWLFGGAAGVFLFAGLGPLTDGIRHAASVASDSPLYGISDERLLANHVLFPLTVVVIVLLVTVVVCSIIVGITAAAPIVSSLVAGLLTLITRVSNALKGSLPPGLLTPIPTPMGDLGAAARLAWAFDGLLLTALAGVGAVGAFESPILLIGVTAAVTAVGINRWRHRT